MTRILVSAALMTLAGISLAQSSFTIRRPVDGATVREMVEVRIPKRSIPAGAGFVGIWVNGRFLEAVAPFEGANTAGEDFVYKLDTKDRRIPDGQMTIEAVLYANRGTVTQPLNKTSVVVRLDNSASIRIPSNGLMLRYPLTPNMEYVYGVEMKSTIQSLTDAQAQLGSRAGEVEGEPQRFRYRVTVLNRYPQAGGGREGLLLFQPLTPRGQDYAMLITAGATEPAKYYDYMMAPMYMRVNDRGREIYGARPFYAPSGASVGELNRLDLLALFPLPILPPRGIRPGGPAWESALPQANLSLEQGYDVEKLTSLLPARGTLEGIEFERGRPCAKVRTVLAQGSPATGVLEFEDYYWFALDIGMPIKVERRFTVTQRVREQGTGGGGGAEGGGLGGSGRTSGGAGQGPATGAQSKSLSGEPFVGPGGSSDGLRLFGPGLLFTPESLNQLGRDGDDDSREGGRPGGGGFGNQGRPGAGGGGQGGRTRLLRNRTVITMTLE